MDDDASIVIINTCGFIDNAKQESIDTIIRYADAKAEGLVDKVYVTGCLSERYKDDLEKEIPKDASAQTKRELFNSLIKYYTDKFDQCQELKHLNHEQLEKAKKIYDFHISKSANKYVHILR